MAQKSSILRKIDDPEILGQIRPKIDAPEKNPKSRFGEKYMTLPRGGVADLQRRGSCRVLFLEGPVGLIVGLGWFRVL